MGSWLGGGALGAMATKGFGAILTSSHERALRGGGGYPVHSFLDRTQLAHGCQQPPHRSVAPPELPERETGTWTYCWPSFIAFDPPRFTLLAPRPNLHVRLTYPGHGGGQYAIESISAGFHTGYLAKRRSCAGGDVVGGRGQAAEQKLAICGAWSRDSPGSVARLSA